MGVMKMRDLNEFELRDIQDRLIRLEMKVEDLEYLFYELDRKLKEVKR